MSLPTSNRHIGPGARVMDRQTAARPARSRRPVPLPDLDPGRVPELWHLMRTYDEPICSAPFAPEPR